MRIRHLLIPLLSIGVAACAAGRGRSGVAGEAGEDSLAVSRLLGGTPHGAWESAYAPLPSTPTLLRNATVMTAAGEEIRGGDVLLEDGHIVAIGRGLEAPPGATVVDAPGGL